MRLTAHFAPLAFVAVAFTATARELLPAWATIIVFSTIAFLCIGRASRCKFSYAQSAPPWTSFRQAFVQIMALNAAAVTFLSLLGLFIAWIAWIASGQSDPADKSREEGKGSSADFGALGTLWSSFVHPISFIGFLGQLISFLHRMDSDLYPSPAHQLPPSFNTLPPTLSDDGQYLTSEHIVAPTAAQIHRDFVKRLSLRALVRITSAKLAAALALAAFVVGPSIVARLLEVIFSIQLPAVSPDVPAVRLPSPSARS